MATSFKIERGAAWRRWDLHVHTPESVIGARASKNSYYGDWDSYLDAIEAKSELHEISVIGVTDYWSIEGYKRLFKEKSEGRLGHVDLLIPNIECRFALNTQSGKPFNLHLLIDPTSNGDEAPDAHIAKIEAALVHLRFEAEGGKYFSCTQDDLIALGESVETAPTDQKGRLKLGTQQFRPSHDVFLDWLDKGAGDWIVKHSMLAVSNGHDGISGMTATSGLTAVQGRIKERADLIFSGRDADRKHYLSLSTPKPCVHGCDAHALFEPADKRFCWIKSDPKFVGLRQILREPAERVWIGPSKPGPADPAKIIDKVTLKGSPWFKDAEILLNPGLVAVVGEKGSGKTALGELIARAAGVKIEEPRFGAGSQTFVGRAGKGLGGLSVEIDWANGDQSSVVVNGELRSSADRVRYLSQDFVERLCSEDYTGENLVTELEKMVFRHLPIDERLDSATFEELRQKHTAALERQKSDLRSQISKLNGQIDTSQQEIEHKHSLEQEVVELEVEISRLNALLKAAQSEIDPTALKNLEEATAKAKAFETELSGLKERRADLTNAIEAYEMFKRSMYIGFTEVEAQLDLVGVSSEDVKAFSPSFQGYATVILQSMLNDIDVRISSLESPAVGDVEIDVSTQKDSLNRALQNAQQLVSIDQQVRDKILKIREQLSEREQKLKSIQHRLERLVTSENYVVDWRQRRIDCYKGVLQSLQEESSILRKLYQPLTNQIAGKLAETKTDKFSVGVRLRCNWKGWLEKCPDFFDRRKPSKVDVSDERSKNLREALVSTPGGDELIALIGQLDQELGTRKEISERLRSGFNSQDVADWLYDTSNITVGYVLEYGGVELTHLSPGTRGIVLLLLYLLVDDKDNRPLIVDQPEGNLDNSSVAEALVPFIRTSKRERQIIIVSHNPNLVVVTDAEQIIVSEAQRPSELEHPVMTYSAGAFEAVEGEGSPHEETIRILEGGRSPFSQRTEGYRIARRD